MKSNKTAITLLAAALFMFSVWWAFAATPPNTVSYQGFLTDAAGSPINGTPDMQVVFFTASTGGTGVYTETHSSVAVSNGQFNVQLGTGTTSGTWATDVDFSQALWLEITVGAETLTPRIPLSTVPYARYALTANTATTADALSANGANCGAGNYPLGVDASGAVEGCTAAGGGSGDVTDVGDSAGPTAFTGANDGNSLTFEGTTDDGNDTTLSAANATASRAIILPDASGRVALEPTSNCASGEILESDGSGNWTCGADDTGGGGAGAKLLFSGGMESSSSTASHMLSNTLYCAPSYDKCFNAIEGYLAVSPSTCTLKNLYGSVQPYVANFDGGSLIFTLVKNEVATALTCTINPTINLNAHGSCNDTSNTVSVTAGDRLMVKLTGSATEGGSTLQAGLSWGMICEE